MHIYVNISFIDNLLPNQLLYHIFQCNDPCQRRLREREERGREGEQGGRERGREGKET